jgi:hypothetical protein
MSQIPPNFLDAVVPLSHVEAPEQRWESHGTGFLFAAQRILRDTAIERLFLVTAKHNFLDQNNHLIPWIYLGCNREVPAGQPQPAQNPQEARSGVFMLDLVDDQGQPAWTTHERVDVAVIPIPGNELVNNHLRYHYFHGDNHAWRIGEMSEANCSEGDGIFLIGFPSNLDEHIGFFPVVRNGCIARVRDTLTYAWPNFVVASLVSVGNSGSPVIIHPSLWHVEDTTGPQEARLVGVVSDFRHHMQAVVDQNNQADRIFRFPQNTGLVTVWTVDLIEHLISEHLLRFPALLPQLPLEQ